jgi:hypothetical protein
VTLTTAGRVQKDALGLHPVWRILLSAEKDGPSGGSESPRVNMCELLDRSSWRPELTAAMETTTPSGFLLVNADRGLPQALLGLVSHSRWKRSRSPSLRKVRALLHESGFEILTEYSVWPSTGNPRVALRASSFRAFNWIQRSGVLGGGGDRVGARALARSALFTPIAYVLAPRVAFIARRLGARDPDE